MTAPRPGPARTVGRQVWSAIDALPLLLVIAAEAAWLTVAMGLVEEWALRLPVLGLAAMVAFVVAGVLAGRILGPRLGQRWPLAALGLAIAGALAGWLSSPDPWAAIGDADLARALASHPGGWLAGVAVVRGYAHAARPLSEATVARMLGLGIPALAIMAALGGVIAEPWRTAFLDDAFVASIAFVATATLGLAFIRLGLESGGAGLAWRRNPAWAGLLAVVLLIAVWVAIPASTMTGTAISWLVGLAIGPLLVLGLIASFQAPGRRTILRALAVAAFLVVLGQLVRPGADSPATGGGGGSSVIEPANRVDVVLALGLGVLVLPLAALAVIVLARLWMRRAVAPGDDILETRSIDRGLTAIPSTPRLRRRRSASTPVDATTAYLALLDDLVSRPAVGRVPAETPAEHAGRLRRAGRAGLPLDLLAADYELARYGGVRLSEAEDRRAVRRWRQLRLALGRREPRHPGTHAEMPE